MFSKIIVLALAASPLVAAHGKIAVVTGDLGGNGTALGIEGAVIPGAGANYQTEPDTTTFWSKDIKTDDDLGYTDNSNGNLAVSDLAATMALSGSTLPQVSSGGSVSGTFHVVTSDGFGALSAVIDPTAAAKWSTSSDMVVTTQVPGTGGYLTSSDKRSTARRWLETVGVLSKRATNINKDYDFAVAIPAGTTCTGTINGMSNVCLIKVSNNNENGPFGGTFAVQMSNSTTTRRVIKRSTKFSA